MLAESEQSIARRFTSKPEQQQAQGILPSSSSVAARASGVVFEY